ncbi:MAG: carbohydrate kinase family protein [Lachnospiraceae bacterium]|nr:carbohydrate kinase family protein [Lachnospiraceae bacterium]
MNKHDIYLYGMICYTSAYLLRGDFPKADGYSEIKEKYFFPGGETGAAATVLAALGLKVKVDGNYTGAKIDKQIRNFYDNIGVDSARLFCEPGYDGAEDMVIISGDTRTIFGQFASYFEDYYHRNIVRWSTPKEEDIKGVKAAGIDPFFGAEAVLAARLCRENDIPFVTIDERFDHEVVKLASIVAISSDWIRDFMPDYYSENGKEELIKLYMANTSALVIFTGGGGQIIYGRNGEIEKTNAFKVDVVSTLGAGDTFKAGCIYGLAKGWADKEIIKFASALAAITCTKFPMAYNPPTLDEVNRLLNS